METQGNDIRLCFDELCAIFNECVSIIPMDVALVSTLTSIYSEIIEYLATASGIKLPITKGTKSMLKFNTAIDLIVTAVNNLIEAFRQFISILQMASLEHVAVADILIPLDLILLISRFGYIIYDAHVGRILLGPVRIRGVPITARVVLNTLSTHSVYKYLESCINLGDFYEYEDVIFTVGSIHLRELSVSAVKKFIDDVWLHSSLR
ncbi:hypothetical protein F-M6_0339 [Faustovirus]|nr:hypothetical protein F-LCD7_0334 [Faustovirus]QJX72102.1 hypothetical protein F-M6_0339 [Faustovirus]QJX73093.1 hypothetical protein F-VV57_0332 [Faustovirus]QJX73600.1 hypothetical protein F-VV63_0334 [Faustovirus]